MLDWRFALYILYSGEDLGRAAAPILGISPRFDLNYSIEIEFALADAEIHALRGRDPLRRPAIVSQALQLRARMVLGLRTLVRHACQRIG